MLPWLHLFNHWNCRCSTPWLKKKQPINEQLWRHFPRDRAPPLCCLSNWFGWICKELMLSSSVFISFYFFLTFFFNNLGLGLLIVSVLISILINCTVSNFPQVRFLAFVKTSALSVALCLHWLPVIPAWYWKTWNWTRKPALFPRLPFQGETILNKLNGLSQACFLTLQHQWPVSC